MNTIIRDNETFSGTVMTWSFVTILLRWFMFIAFRINTEEFEMLS